VVAWVDGMMCSAGQFAGSYCREIIASRETDLVGSIGTMTIWEGRKANSLEDSEGVIHQRIYADDATQKNEEFETAINDGNFKLTRERILNPLNFEFVSEIRKSRPGVEDKHLHGRAFPADEVVGSLVDYIGDFNYAIQRVIALSGYRSSVETSSGERENNKNQNQKTTHMKRAWNTQHRSPCLYSPCEFHGPDERNMNAQVKIIEEQNINNKTILMKFTKLGALLGPDPMEFETDGRRTFTDDETSMASLT
jgi:ClpP class serine protease